MDDFLKEYGIACDQILWSCVVSESYSITITIFVYNYIIWSCSSPCLCLKISKKFLKSFDGQLANIFSKRTRPKSMFVIHDFSSHWWINTWCIVILEALLHTLSYLQAGSFTFTAYPGSRTKTLHPISAAITYGAQTFQISVYTDKKRDKMYT
jgi:hypothetical protein